MNAANMVSKIVCDSNHGAERSKAYSYWYSPR